MRPLRRFTALKTLLLADFLMLSRLTQGRFAAARRACAAACDHRPLAPCSTACSKPPTSCTQLPPSQIHTGESTAAMPSDASATTRSREQVSTRAELKLAAIRRQASKDVGASHRISTLRALASPK